MYTNWYILKRIMKILEVTSRDFRDKQRAYFELADKGQKVIIRRGKKRAYMLTPITPDDVLISPEMEIKIEQAMQDLKDGKTTVVKTKQELNDFLESL